MISDFINYSAIIWIIFVSLGAIANSVMDTLKDHFSISIFVHLNPYFWFPDISWNAKYNSSLPDALTDGWHVFKLIMLTMLMFHAFTFKHITNFQVILPDYYKISEMLNYGVDSIIWYIAWNGPFSLFYNKILKRKVNE